MDQPAAPGSPAVLIILEGVDVGKTNALLLLMLTVEPATCVNCHKNALVFTLAPCAVKKLMMYHVAGESSALLYGAGTPPA